MNKQKSHSKASSRQLLRLYVMRYARMKGKKNPAQVYEKWKKGRLKVEHLEELADKNIEEKLNEVTKAMWDLEFQTSYPELYQN